MKCLECGNVVLANALSCDCGYEFSSKPQTTVDQQDAPKFTSIGDDPDLGLGKAGSGPTDVEKAAFFEALRESTPRLFITPILLGLNLLVFALMLFSGVSPLEPTGQELLQWGANFGPLTVNYGWWRIFACTFLHIGFMHLAFNMWCLWSLGSLAERLFGNWTFLMLYVLSGLGGSICSLLWNPTVISAGASGAIFGVAGGLVMFWQLGHLSVPKSVIKSDLNSLLFFVGYNLFYGLTSEGVDNAGHVGGLLVGLLMGAFLHRPLPSRKPVARLRRYLVYSGVTFLIVLGLSASKGRLANDPLARSIEAEILLETGEVNQAIAAIEAILASSWEWGDYGQEAIESANRENLARAYYNLGFMYHNGQGVPQDYAEAVTLYRKAAEQGNAIAQINLGFMCHNGQGVPQDYAEAVTLYRKAAEQGYAQAWNNLGWLYATAKDPRFRDPAQAVECALKAVALTEEKNPHHHDTLAEAYFVSGEQGKAVETIRKAIALEPNIKYFQEQLDRFEQGR